eukprot:TRINITY_DN19464_c0_g1_i1.p1 TRINITY_DN19464_c0_g1~~TRINITY_DN19464_c0_g1_i1.p1  ORF type:complete len:410 (-),score=100.99 TRINITY_DN19464_c0_g1_i1:159-1388(-)
MAQQSDRIDKKVCLQSCDGELYEIDNDVVSMCATVKNMLKGKSAFRNSLGGQFSIDGSYVILKKEGRVLASLTKNDEEEAIVTLPDVKASTLEKVIEYCKFHNGAAAASSTVSEREKKAWDSEFVQVKQSVLCELASASYYLDIKPLVNLTSRAIATQISASSLATRCRLQRKFNRKKQEEKDQKATSTENDNRSVEELLEFIGEEGTSGPKPAQKTLTSSSSATSQGTSGKKKQKKPKKKKGKQEKDYPTDASDDFSREEETQMDDDASISTEGLSEEITERIRDSLSRHSSFSRRDNRENAPSSLDLDSPSSSPSQSRDEENKTLHDDNLEDSSSSNSSVGSPEDEQFWSEEDDLDPKQRADLDKEVEEFRQRLESVNTENQNPKQKIPLPVSASSFVNSLVGVGVH